MMHRPLSHRLARRIPPYVGAVYAVCRLYLQRVHPETLVMVDAYLDHVGHALRAADTDLDSPDYADPDEALAEAAARLLWSRDVHLITPEARRLIYDKAAGDEWLQHVLTVYVKYFEPTGVAGGRIDRSLPRLCAAWGVHSVDELRGAVLQLLQPTDDEAAAAPREDLTDDALDMLLDFIEAPANDGRTDDGDIVPGRFTVLQRLSHKQREVLLAFAADPARWESLVVHVDFDDSIRNAFAQPKPGGWVVSPAQVTWDHVRDHLVQLLMLAGTMSATVQM